VNRRTIRQPVRLSGAGLLNRRRVSVVLKPGRTGQGIIFNERIKATPGRASVKEHTTCLGRGRNRVCMVEHLLAACAGLGVTDLNVESTGGELPFCDGSSLPYFSALDQAGVVELDAELTPLTDVGSCLARDKTGFLWAEPAPCLRITCIAALLGYPGPDELSLDVTPAVFAKGLAGARTCGPLAEELRVFRRRHGIGFRLVRRGGVVYPKDERMEAEPVRHKILDLIGDLWLLGRPVCADIYASFPNHKLNLAFAREMEAQ